ncbi:hypothetical protein UPYG_G00132130 [Umbra pygmaea]|uniref:Sprouty-related, EVH1 domain-containing protein 2 n=1 Tax=Umbra pygmaea TaxID=75934 RepID=A0ABD0XE71_UMBPY
MIEETHPNDDSYIVRVKAVVMVRDDSGWLAQDGGALSRVGVCRILSSDLGLAPLGQSYFLIHGERLLDKQVILECAVRKDLKYHKATPTFHHWKVEERKCGLTFQSPADARAFERGVRKAIEDMTEGSTTSSSTLQNEAELGDDDVFTNATDSSSNSSSQKLESCMQPLDTSPLCDSSHPQNNPIPDRHNLHQPYRPSDHYFLDLSQPRLPRQVTFQEEEEIVRINPLERSWELPLESSSHCKPRRDHQQHLGLTDYDDYRHTTRDIFIHPPDDSESYVHFTKSDPHKHEYNYPLAPAPLLHPSDAKPALRHSSRSCHHRSGGQDFGGGVVCSQPRPLLSVITNGEDKKSDEGGAGERLQCQYCEETFHQGNNRRGHCQDAPDPVKVCVRRVSCLWLADTMLYHCMSDPEGEYSDPCSCEVGSERGAGGRLVTRWAALLALSLLAPCLCLYPPLHACHRVGVACGCCGGRHNATKT